jgi:hypothetical protein
MKRNASTCKEMSIDDNHIYNIRMNRLIELKMQEYCARFDDIKAKKICKIITRHSSNIIVIHNCYEENLILSTSDEILKNIINDELSFNTSEVHLDDIVDKYIREFKIINYTSNDVNHITSDVHDSIVTKIYGSNIDYLGNDAKIVLIGHIYNGLIDIVDSAFSVNNKLVTENKSISEIILCGRLILIYIIVLCLMSMLYLY